MANKHLFTKVAGKVATFTGSPIAAGLALATVLIWAVSGPIFGYSEVWQLVINTGTTIITFLMVFLIQNTQNRDSRAMQIKLDELIRTTKGAHTALLDLEELNEDELRKICHQYEKIAQESRKLMRKGKDDTAIPHVELADTAEGIRAKRKKRAK